MIITNKSHNRLLNKLMIKSKKRLKEKEKRKFKKSPENSTCLCTNILNQKSYHTNAKKRKKPLNNKW